MRAPLWYPLAALPALAAAAAQTGGFVVTLGNDTVQVERFTRTSTRIEGTVATRVPQTRIAAYSLTLNSDGSPAQYTLNMRSPDGTILRGDGQAGTMTFTRDSIVRETLAGGASTTSRIAFTAPAFPNLAGSYLAYELGIAALRKTAAASATAPRTFATLTMFPTQTRPSANQVWLIGTDSAEIDFFGVARSGWKFDNAGQVIRSDWGRTTLKYQVIRVASVDIDAIARRWADADARGAGIRALSPRDTMRAAVNGARIAIEYSRPSKRGRQIWGAIVPWDTVWRLGADVATHMETDQDIVLGGTRVPAGRYTLWMLPSSRGASQLIVNSRINIFGTQYNGTGDFARIPLTPVTGLSPLREQLTIEVRDGRLWIVWDDRAWTVPMMR